MKRLSGVILVGVIILVIQTGAFAVDLGKVGMFSAGAVAGIFAHEVGHAVTTLALGGRVDGMGLSYTNIDFTHQDAQRGYANARIAVLAGYATSTIISEIILRNREWHENDFALGMMSLGIFTNLNNVWAYYVRGDRDIDLGQFEKWGGDPALPAILMVAHSGLSIYRIFRDTDIVPYVGNKILGFSFTW